jgi:hypothetical protein
MRTGTTFFYLDTKKIRDRQEFYEVIEVPVYNNNLFKADEKAKRIADILGKRLAGGLFDGRYKPSDFEKNYTIYKYQIKEK